MAKTNNYKHWRSEKDDDNIAWLTLDKAGASTNALSKGVLEELELLLDGLEQDLPRGVIIQSGKDNGFIAGADITEFTTIADQSEAEALINRGQGIMDRIEALECPTLSMINGFCLGGGLELALACDYRIADDGKSTRLGLPEILLGIHPGFGGVLRSTRLLGAPTAMNMMLTGRSVDARRAKRMGLVDQAVPTRHLHNGARQMILTRPPRHKASLMQRLSNATLVRPLLAWVMRRTVAKKASRAHYPAPYALIDLWAKHGGNAKAMLRGEAHSVATLVRGDTAQNLIEVFFLQERLKSEGDKSLFTPLRVHVIGGGVMGGDIAAWCALQGMRVTIQDRKHETLARVIKRAHGLYKKKLKRPRPIQEALDNLVPDMDGLGIPQADVIIEAIFENIEAKQGLFKEIEPQMKEGAILATNTSSIPLETLGEVLQQPDRLVGLHFFNPVAKMQLVEIVYTASTDPEMIKKAAAFTRHIDRLPLPVKSSPGFLVNRVLMPYLIEAVVLVSEGVPASAIDQAAVDFGMPMGPILLADTVGLDICLSVAKILGEAMGTEVPERLKQMVEAGQLGRKSGQGFYRYDKGEAQVPEPNMNDKVPDDLTDRLMLRFVNEAVAVLREGVVADADLLDGGVIFGTGFAPFRGGPMHYLRAEGKEALHERLQVLEQAHGSRFKPDAGWNDL